MVVVKDRVNKTLDRAVAKSEYETFFLFKPKKMDETKQRSSPNVLIAFSKPCLLLCCHGKSSTTTAPESSGTVLNSVLGFLTCRLALDQKKYIRKIQPVIIKTAKGSRNYPALDSQLLTWP